MYGNGNTRLGVTAASAQTIKGPLTLAFGPLQANLGRIHSHCKAKRMLVKNILGRTPNKLTSQLLRWTPAGWQLVP